MLEIALWVLGIYLALGVATVFLLSVTPYSANPLWTKVLLWPLFILGLFGIL